LTTSFRVFFGHDFFGGDEKRLVDYRRKIKRGCSAAAKVIKTPINPLFGNSKLDPALIDAVRNAGGNMPGVVENRFWPKIDGLLRMSHLGIFDLSLPDGAPNEINWNVLMELGVALGHGIPIRVIVRDRSAVVKRLSNLAGVQIEECRRPADLGQLIKELVAVFGKASLSL
jgi:hypothetical protein